jgi:hypothetical protein
VSTERRAFFVWRRGGQPSGRGEAVVAAPVDKNALDETATQAPRYGD